MDANKLQVLRDLEYRIMPCCSNCKSGLFTHPGHRFGTCQIKTYEHLKHSGPERQLSVHEHGYCQDHEFDDDFIVCLSHWKEFARE